LCKQGFPAGYIGLLLLSIVWVIDVFGANVKFSVQSINKRFGPFYLEVCWLGGIAIGYDADADGLAGSVPGLAGYD